MKRQAIRVLMATTVVVGVGLGISQSRSEDAQRGGGAQGGAPARMGDGKPNLNGIWQTMSTANWDLEAHSALAGPPQLGALLSMPASKGVVEGGTIPYKAEALAKKKANLSKRWSEDTEAKCYLPGVPRFVYLPYAFQIVQSAKFLMMTSEYAGAVRLINMGPPTEAPVDSWMGHSKGKWEGDTLVVTVDALNGNQWLDRAGNYTSENVKITERFTLVNPERMQYEATLTDPSVFTRPWKINLMLTKHMEPSGELMEFRCVEFAEELLYGKSRKPTRYGEAGHARGPAREAGMKGRWLLSVTVAALIAGIIMWGYPDSSVVRAQASAAGATGAKYSVPKTPWGDPDLEGVWQTELTSTPLERPRALGTRQFLN